MAVLIERVSLVITRRSISALYPGGWNRFQFDVAEHCWCSDEDLVSISFTDTKQLFAFWDDCDDTVSHAGPRGDPYRLEVHPVDHLSGPLLPCKFLVFQVLRLDASPALVSVASFKTPRNRVRHVTRIALSELAAPRGWQFEQSASEAGQQIRRGWNSLPPGH